jgi:cell division protein FtsI (penicillin-binding protein 3)
MLHRFGFGSPTGVDLPGERGGLLRPLNKWGEIGLATISFGQGVTATPLQIATGYAAIANGGVLNKPHLLRKVVDEKGRVLVEGKVESRRVLAPDVARTMRTMLHAVTEKGGTGEKLAIPGYPAAGKTGTAQKVDPVTHRYSTEKWASSFVGFAPLDDPRLVIFVLVDEPTGTHYGGAVAGPIWREVMVDALRYLNVTPTADAALAQAAAAKSSAAAVALAEPPRPRSAPPAVETGAAAADESESPAAGAAADEAEPAGPQREIPDFTGMSLGEALDAARKAQLPLEVAGSGRAVAQEPPPGRAPLGARCRVKFAPPG